MQCRPIFEWDGFCARLGLAIAGIFHRPAHQKRPANANCLLGAFGGMGGEKFQLFWLRKMTFCACANLQNMMAGNVQQLFLGGHHAVNSKNTEETEFFLEEMFPLFERSLIRSSPVDLRSTFPVQLFGLKSSIELLDEVSNKDTCESWIGHLFALIVSLTWKNPCPSGQNIKPRKQIFSHK